MYADSFQKKKRKCISKYPDPEKSIAAMSQRLFAKCLHSAKHQNHVPSEGREPEKIVYENPLGHK